MTSPRDYKEEGGWKQVESPRGDYLKKVEDSLDNIFSRFQQLAVLTPTH